MKSVSHGRKADRREKKKKNLGTKVNKWKLGSGLNPPKREQRDGTRRGFDTKVIRSERNFSFPVRLIEKCCWVTAPHAGVKIKARGSALFCGCGSFGRAPAPDPERARPQPTRERAESGEGRRRRSEERVGGAGHAEVARQGVRRM